jgi:hypothetical protein
MRALLLLILGALAMLSPGPVLAVLLVVYLAQRIGARLRRNQPPVPRLRETPARPEPIALVRPVLRPSEALERRFAQL